MSDRIVHHGIASHDLVWERGGWYNPANFREKVDDMISIFVTIRIKEGYADEFTEASFGDAQGSVRDEPGCFRFDILANSEDPNLFHLYEVYADDAALDAHREAPHYKTWRSSVEHMFDGDIERVAMTTVFPSDDGWRDQKPHLMHW